MNKVRLDFSVNRYTDAELSVKALTIVKNLDGNAFFPTLAPNVMIITGLTTTFNDLISKMADGYKRLTSEKNKVRFDLVQALCEAGRLVQNVSKGDEVMIHSSGFDRNRKPCFVERLDQASDMKVKPGKISGTLDVSWNKLNHSRGYLLRYTKAPVTEASEFETITTSKRSVTLEGFIPGEQYAVQVAGVGSDPHQVWSMLVFSYVL